MRKSHQLLVGSLLSIAVATTADAAVIYTENFPNSGAGNIAMNNTAVGWTALLSTPSAPNAADNSGNIFGTSGFLVSNNQGFGGVGGYGALASNATLAGLRGLAFTTEAGAALSAADRSLLLTLSVNFVSNNANTASLYRVAIRIGSDWFASDTSFSSSANSTNVNFPLSSGTTSHSLAFANLTAFQAATAWRDATFAVGSPLSVAGSARTAALPAGGINAFGLFLDRTTAAVNTMRFDAFNISYTLIPEPTTAAAIALVAACTLGRRRLA